MKKYLIYFFFFITILCGCKSKEDNLKEIAVKKSIENVSQNFEVYNVNIEEFNNPLLFDKQSVEYAKEMMSILKNIDYQMNITDSLSKALKKENPRSKRFDEIYNQMNEIGPNLYANKERFDELTNQINYKKSVLGQKYMGQKIDVILYDKTASSKEDSILEFTYIFDENGKILYDSHNDPIYKQKTEKGYNVMRLLD